MSDEMTIAELLDALRLGSWFRDRYLMPMCGAIWSTPVEEVDQFPAMSLVQFFRNHALLAGMPQHQWWTVKGGSIEYVRRLETALIARGCSLRTGSAVNTVKRDPRSVSVSAKGTGPESFDELIFACHSDQALKILGHDVRPAEQAALSKIRFEPNRAVLHRDPSQMPKRKACWTSWSYRAQEKNIGVTYWMNRLQSLPENDPLFVTLNPATDIPDELIYDDVTFAHPVFDKMALKAQRDIRAMQGQNRTWFAGAWNRHGFHEDGIASAMRITRALKRRYDLEGARDEAYQQGSEIELSEYL